MLQTGMLPQGTSMKKIKIHLFLTAYRRHISVCLVWLLAFTTVFSTFYQNKVQAEETGAPFSYQEIDFGFAQEELDVPDGEMPAALSLTEDPDAPEAQMASGGTVSLPEIYDPRQSEGSLVPLRDQNPYGCCWAFAALGACEASMVAKGVSANAIDLSERHLAYYFYKKGAQTSDPLGGTLGDYNANVSSQSYLDIGGNNLLTIWHLAGWCGPVAEETAPYAGLLGNKNADEAGLLGLENSTQMAYENDAVHLQNAYVIDIGNSYEDESQRNTVKELILEYGALAMSYYADKSTTYDNPENDCYYYDGTYKYKTNHAVQVVGWDDSFPKEKFNEGHRPDGDGAWLMKNSWGEENDTLAQNGYFWLSYYDYALRYATGITNTQKLVYVYDCESADNYDNIYQHDGDAGHKRFGKDSTLRKVTSLGNVFTAGANEGKKEMLCAVGIGVSSAGATYTLSVYTDLTAADDPKSGTLVHTQQGTIPFNGYHTVELEKDVVLDYGQSYAVVFDFDEGVYAYASRSFVNSPWEFVSENTKGRSFAIPSGSTEWLDCAEADELHDACALRIKAYTDNTDQISEQPAELTAITMSEQNVSLKTGETLQLTASAAFSDGKPHTAKITWSTSDASVALVGSSGLVTALQPGSAVITAVSGGKSAQCQVTVTATQITTNPEEDPDTGDGTDDPPVTPAELISLTLSRVDASVVTGKTLELSAEPVYSQENATDWMVYWKSSDSAVAAVNDCGVVTAKKPGKALITVYNGEISASCSVTVLPKQQTIAGTSPKKNQLTIKLTKQSGVDGYVIYRSTSEKGTYRAVKTLQGSKSISYTGKALKGTKPYYYKVRAYKTIDGKRKYGAYSQVCTVRPKAAELTKAKAYGGGKVRLTWKKVSGADGYVVYRSTKKNSGYKRVGVLRGAKQLTLTDRNVKRNQTYYYKVRVYRTVNGKKIYGAYSAVKTVSVR